ncbi:MAG: lipoyl(octanoyl) transferase LipB [Magnetococcales bacterium]|nr:lipoyl(octanoyl) transferase LipB [Magnetococcales bacterium]
MKSEVAKPNTCPYDLWRPGRVDYTLALSMQQQRVETLLTRGGPNLLLLLEHPPVYTMGRSGKRDEVLAMPPGHAPVPLILTDRGGRVTYHGPGQLVAYVIRDLRPDTGRVLDHVRRLEAVVLATLAAFGIQGMRESGNPGVWVAGEKIAALGVRIRRGITYHGIAINRDVDLTPYSGIIPCGLQGRGVTSLERLGCRVSETVLQEEVLRAFCEVFAAHLTEIFPKIDNVNWTLP